jgi:hypothetical protein
MKSLARIAGLIGLIGMGVLSGYAALSAPPPKATRKKPPVAGTRTAASPVFWSFRPVKRPPVPKVKNAAWIRNPIDAFILAELEKRGLTPAPPADKRTLLRRVTFDLTGLPPTPEEIEAFLRDTSPQAYEKVVERLLASPRYGERWGRHWLDLVRYTDSLDSRDTGTIRDINDAWRYRDWVVEAFNSDMPYDRFVQYQIAGDLLPAPGAADDINKSGIIATGMLAIGNWGNGNSDKPKVLTDIADDQIDVISRGVMGITLACARCHDHKYDPFTMKDYYGMAGIFLSTHILPKLTPNDAVETPLKIPLLSKAERAERDRYASELAAAKMRFVQTAAVPLKQFARSQISQTARYLRALQEYRARPAAAPKWSLEAFAQERGLLPFALRQWRDYLEQGDYKRFSIPVRDYQGVASVYQWRGEAETPWLVVNTNMATRTIGTWSAPSLSVVVHPGPNNGVVIGWQSPVEGNINVLGGLISADPNGGDGIAWMLDHRTANGAKTLASGDIPAGGSQALGGEFGDPRLKNIRVRKGDMLQLLVLPLEDEKHDATLVLFGLEETESKRTWYLSRDIFDNVLENGKGNPHSDLYGNPEVWHFYETGSSHRVRPGAERLRAALLNWRASADGAQRDDVIARAAEQVQAAFQIADESSPFWIRERADWKYLPAPDRAALEKAASAWDALLRSAPPPVPYANGAQEGGCPESLFAGTNDCRIFQRGDYKRPGEVVPRRFPSVLIGNQPQPRITQGSGRLELARWLTHPRHPLTYRVIVNRLWQHHFGQGIVRTPSNFGRLGERPTHPAMLDWLASELTRQQGSLKQMHRLILLSATYRQGSGASARGMQTDPDNRFWSRFSRRRLEAEALRDSLLAVSGQLDTTMGGVGERDFNRPRRTLYLMTIRSERTGFCALFDGADSTAISDQRTQSNVAPQALFLLNSEFALARAEALAARLIQEVPQEETARILRIYLLLYGRPPQLEETRIGQAFLARARQGQAAVAAPGTPEQQERAAWKQYAHLLLCANEFLYVD